MKFFRKTGWKLLLDIVMAVLLALMYNKRVFGMEFHEIGGLALCGLFIIHKLLNFKWIKTITKGLFNRKTPMRQKLYWILDLLLLLSFAFILVSGILISKIVFPNLFANTGGNMKVLHYGVSAIALALSGIHLGLHMGWIRQRMAFLNKVPAILRKVLAIVISVAVLAFGVYSLTTTSFLSWITNIGSSFSTAVPTIPALEQTSTDESENSADAVEFSATASDVELEAHTEGGNGAGLGDGLGPHGDGEGNGATESSVVSVLASFLSIMFGFAVITAWLNGAGMALKRRRFSKTAVAD